MTIRERIAEAYLARRSRLFVHEQFVGSGVSEEMAKEALRALAGEHYLSVQIEVKCAYGHGYWGGDELRFQREAPLSRQCDRDDCETLELDEEERSDEQYQPKAFYRYKMTKPWLEALDAQKKTPQAPS